MNPIGVAGGGTSGTPSRSSALALLVSKRALSSSVIEVLVVSASSAPRISSNARRFGDSSALFLGGSRRLIRGWTFALGDPVALCGVTTTFCGGGTCFGSVGRETALLRVLDVLAGLCVTDDMESCFRDFRRACAVPLGSESVPEETVAAGAWSCSCMMTEGALLASKDDGLHSGQFGNSGGSSYPVASKHERCHPRSHC